MSMRIKIFTCFGQIVYVAFLSAIGYFLYLESISLWASLSYPEFAIKLVRAGYLDSKSLEYLFGLLTRTTFIGICFLIIGYILGKFVHFAWSSLVVIPAVYASYLIQYYSSFDLIQDENGIKEVVLNGISLSSYLPDVIPIIICPLVSSWWIYNRRITRKGSG